jgi:hypothetical protein
LDQSGEWKVILEQIYPSSGKVKSLTPDFGALAVQSGE